MESLSKEEILNRMSQFTNINQSNTVCVSKFHFLKINPFANTVLSCCKAFPEDINLDKVKDISTLDDLVDLTSIRSDRKEMLEGKRPSSCEFCWKVETHPDAISQRHQDSIVKYTNKRTSQMRVDQEIEFLEVSLNNTCNLRCMYCAPSHSSRIESDTVLNGPLRHAYPFIPLAHRELEKEQQQINQKTLTDVIIHSLPHLRTIMLTGGEPLLDADIWRILEALEAPRTTPIHISIVTNLSHKKPIIDRLVNSVKRIISDESKVMIVVSCDTIGVEAERIRDGLDYDMFIHNLNYILDELSSLGVRVMISSTISSLSIKSKIEWIDSLEEMFLKYPSVIMNLSTVTGVDFLTPKALPPAVTRSFIKQIDQRMTDPVFEERIINWESVKQRLEHDIDQAAPNKLLIMLKQYLKDRESRYNQDMSVFIKWIDGLLLGY